MWDAIDGSVVIRRPVLNYEFAPLDRVAGKTKHMPDEFMNEAGNT